MSAIFSAIIVGLLTAILIMLIGGLVIVISILTECHRSTAADERGEEAVSNHGGSLNDR